MNGSISNFAREYLVLCLDVAKRRWRLFFLPIVLALPIAMTAGKMTPKKYVAKSLILLQNPNRSSGSEQYVFEQVRAIEAWLKSDQVLRQLLPNLVKISNPDDPLQVNALLNVVRASISLTLLGGSALEVSYTASKPDGLGKKLEAILTRIMEGLTGPERGIFNASQFVLLGREEAVEEARQALTFAISRLDIQSPERIRDLLKQLYTMRPLDEQSFSGKFNLPLPALATGTKAQLNGAAEKRNRLEQQISKDPQIVKDLIKKYATYREALDLQKSMKERLSDQGSNYVGIFDSAGSLLVVGRPQDPIFGESPGLKIAIAIMFLSIMGSGALVWGVELFYSGVRTKAEFEQLSGLPVVARFQRLPRAKV